MVKQKRRHLIRLIIAGLLLAPLAGGAVFAAASSSSPAATTLSQRLTLRQQTLAVHLTNAQFQNIAKKCSQAQTTLQKIKAKDTAIAESRRQTYTNADTKLSAVVDSLERQGIDTASLKVSQTKLNSAINQFLNDSESYKTALDDITAMDCTKDPIGFEATLMDARRLRTQLAKDSLQIKALIPVLTKDLAASKSALTRNLTSTEAAR